METALLPDVLGSTINEGDYLIGQTGKLYVVDFTENSFIRQTILRVRELKYLKRGGFASADSHSYLFPKFALKVNKDQVPTTLPERKAFYERATENQIKKRVDRFLAGR